MKIDSTPVPQNEALSKARQDRLARVLQGDKDSPLRNMLEHCIQQLESGVQEISHRRHSSDDMPSE